MGVLVIGSTVFAAGLVMFVTPGPGWLALILGLAILASEFEWAERLLTRARLRARMARDRALRPGVRRRTLLVVGATSAFLMVVSTTYVVTVGVPDVAVAVWGRAVSWF